MRTPEHTMQDTGAMPVAHPHVEPLTRRPSPSRMLWVTASWGACFIAIRAGLREAPLLWFAALRALVAGVVLVGLGHVQGRPSPRGLKSWSLVGLLGLVNVSLAFGTMFAGVAELATGTAAVLANAQPLLILLPAWWLYGERVDARTGAALAAGFAGLIVVAIPGGGGNGAWLSLLSAAAVTSGTLLSRLLGRMDIVMASGWHFLVGGAVLAAIAYANEGVPHISWTPRFVFILAFLGGIGTAAAFVAWFQETIRCRLSSLTAWTFLVPVFGIVLGLLLLNERPDLWTSAGLLLVLASLWGSLRPRSAHQYGGRSER